MLPQYGGTSRKGRPNRPDASVTACFLHQIKDRCSTNEDERVPLRMEGRRTLTATLFRRRAVRALFFEGHAATEAAVHSKNLVVRFAIRGDRSRNSVQKLGCPLRFVEVNSFSFWFVLLRTAFVVVLPCFVHCAGWQPCCSSSVACLNTEG